MSPNAHQDARLGQQGRQLMPRTAHPGARVHVWPLATREASLGKRKRQQSLPEHVPGNMVAPLNTPQLVSSASGAQTRSPLSHTQFSPPAANIRQPQPWTPISPQSVDANLGDFRRSGQEQSHPRAHLHVNTQGFAQVNTASTIDPAGSVELDPHPQGSLRTPTFVQQLREHANGVISADAVFPSPAASDDSASGLANEAEQRRQQSNDDTSNLIYSTQQIARSQAASSAPWQLPAPFQRSSPMHTLPQNAPVSSQPLPPPPDVYKAEHCFRRIDEFMIASEKEGWLTEIVKQRIYLLKDASRQGDLMYLAMHQIICLQTVAAGGVPYGIQSIPNIRAEFACVDTLLSRNDELPTHFVDWASRFPVDFAHIALSWSYGTACLVELCKGFLTSLSAKYGKMRRACETRRYPPSVREIVRVFETASPILQLTVFLSILRSTWDPSAFHLMNQAEQLFRLEQESYMQRPGLVGPEADEAERTFNNRLQQMYQAQVEERQSEQRGQPSSSIHMPSTFRSEQDQMAHRYFPPRGVPQHQNPREISHGQPNFVPSPTGHPLPRPLPPAPQGAVFGPPCTPPAVPIPHYPVPHRQNFPQPGFLYGPNYPPPVRQNNTQPVLPSQQMSHPSPAQHTPFFPLAGEVRQQAARINPSVSALHQVHLRTPVPVRLAYTEMEPPDRLYQFVTDMTDRRAVSPSRVTEEGIFEVPEELFKSLPRTKPSASLLESPSRTLSETSHLYRFRCAKLAKPEDVSDDGLLATADTFWPEHAYFQVNSTTLEPRRKKQWGKDLPVDITHLIKAGQNSIRVLWNYGPNYKDSVNYASVVEFVSIQSHQAIKQRCLSSQSISSATILDNIKLSLSSSSKSNGNDNDDIAIVDSTISINIFEPYVGSRICDIPVRSRACLHRDCFDLETFLHARPCPRDAPTFSTIDEWHCPICKADARPQNLVVDGFLVEVRKQLEKDGLLDTRAIVVEQNGSWKPKEERISRQGTRNSVSLTPQATQPTQQQRRVTEIIDLDDDADDDGDGHVVNE